MLLMCVQKPYKQAIVILLLFSTRNISNQSKHTSRLVCDRIRVFGKILVDPPNLIFDFWITQMGV